MSGEEKGNTSPPTITSDALSYPIKRATVMLRRAEDFDRKKSRAEDRLSNA